jgi:hypothetical protein
MTGTPHRAAISLERDRQIERVRRALDHARSDNEGKRTAATNGKRADRDRFHALF